MSFTRILAAYDGSDLSRKALDHAIKLASEQDAQLEVLHVYQFPAIVASQPYVTVPNNYQELIEQEAEAVRKQLLDITQGLENTKVTVISGHPAKVILQYAKSLGSDLIVMGSRGLGGFSELVLGSVSHNVVQHSEVPVLVVK